MSQSSQLQRGSIWHIEPGKTPIITISIQAIAGKYQVSQSSLQKRMKGAISKKESNQAKRILCPREEEALRNWCIQLARWR
jgi:hypothetical protein